MAQHDYVIENGAGVQVRLDINAVLNAIITNNSGPTEPTVTYPHMLWPDLTTSQLKQRNGGNSAWVVIGSLDVANLGLATKASPLLTGTPRAPTPATDDDSTTIPTTAHVKNYAAPLVEPAFTGPSITLTATTNAYLQLIAGTSENGLRSKTSRLELIIDGAPKYDITHNVLAAFEDDTGNMGFFNKRWKNIFLTTSPNVSSDKNVKQNIEPISEDEGIIGRAISRMIYKFQRQSAVRLKGEDARIHIGVIAQEFAYLFKSHGLDAGRYGIYNADTWYESPTGEAYKTPDEAPDGSIAKTRLGIRYEELLALSVKGLSDSMDQMQAEITSLQESMKKLKKLN